jgi:hypothetical protein
MQPNSIVTAPEAFKLLNQTGLTLSRAQFYALIQSGSIPTVQIPNHKRYYIRKDDLTRLLQPAVA